MWVRCLSCLFLLGVQFGVLQVQASSDMVELRLPRPDEERQLFRVNGLSLRRVNFDDRTQVVVFFYSASWCVYCKQIAKPLRQLYPELRDSYPGLELVTYSMDDSVSGRAEYLRESGYPWPAIGPAAAKQSIWRLDVPSGIPAFQAFELLDGELVALTGFGAADQVFRAVDDFFARDR